MSFNKPSREEPAINGSSMADIAFLLLIFFLVTTTINVDTGIALILPPPIKDNQEPIKERNLMNILVNSEGLIKMDNKSVSIKDIKPLLKEFITNNGKDKNLSESPLKAVISLKTQRKTPYKIYIDMLDEVMGSYEDLRNEAAIKNYGLEFNQLSPNSSQRNTIVRMYPKKISVAETDDN
jgi:biopolymer transport protein ExbD